MPQISRGQRLKFVFADLFFTICYNVQTFQYKVVKVPNYELVYIVNPGINEEILPETINKVNDVVKKAGGTVLEVTQWGRKKLAYPVKKYTEGSYILSRVQTDPAALKKIDATLKMDDDILRHLIINIGN